MNSQDSDTNETPSERVGRTLEHFLDDGRLDSEEIEALANQLSEVSEEERPEAIGHTLSLVKRQIVMTSGPIPPPEVLAGYEQILPGAADRLLSMAENQSQHRQELESVGLQAAIRHERQGMWIAALLAVFFGILGGSLLFMDKDIVGLAILVPELVGLLALFILSERTGAKELNDKAGQPEEDTGDQ